MISLAALTLASGPRGAWTRESSDIFNPRQMKVTPGRS